jgi:diadenosine tetraphosphate (Ap4A) HIT family hydrolase
MAESNCPFCDLSERGEILAESELAVAFFDAYPVSPGHALVVPRRHEEDYFGLSEEEQLELWRLVGRVRARLVERHRPDGFNLGVNVGEAAGQTIRHVHLHVIPRYEGDQPDARGGIRWVLPDHAPYWKR